MKKSFVARDYWPTKEWKVAASDEAGINKEKLKELEQFIKLHCKNVNGIVIIKNGCIVFERYNGFAPQDTHSIASVTKSFISALIGIAIDKGYIKGVDQKISEIFPESIAFKEDLKKRNITIRQLLTMTAPIASKTIGTRWEPLDRLRRQPDWIKYIIELLGKGQPGKFQYSSAGAHLLSAIITRSTGMCARSFANQHLFKPLGIQTIPDHDMKSFHLEDVFGKNVRGWIKDPQGNSTGGWGLTITPRNMARFGFLYLNNGNWDGKQVISKTWIQESIISNSNKYGYLWWLKNDNISSFAAIGSGGNMICCIPEKDLVIAIATKLVSKFRDPWELINSFLKAIVE